MVSRSLGPKEGNGAIPTEPNPESGSRLAGRHVDLSPSDCAGRGKVLRPYAIRKRSSDPPRLYGLRVYPCLAWIGQPGAHRWPRESSNSWWGGSSDDAVSRVASNPPINQAGNIIRVGEGSGDFMRHVSIDYEITTPANTMLTAESGSGDLQLSNLNGTVRAHTGSGSIRADKLGAGSRLETGSGSIEATQLMGSTTLQTGYGDVRAEFASAGDVVAGTGSGSIKLANVQGAMKAETGSGSLEISGQPTSPWKLETGSGDITMQVSGNAGFTVDAQTGSGDVKTNLPLTVRGPLNKHHVTGTVNGGGPTIKAETGSGDVRIQ